MKLSFLLFRRFVPEPWLRFRRDSRGHDTPLYLEVEQAVIRVVIGALILAYVLFQTWRDGAMDADEAPTLAFTVGFFVFAVALAIRVHFATNVSVLRRIGAIVADNTANTFFMLLSGEYGAAVVGVYLFVTFGYGFRYGRPYLHISQALAVIGFAVVLWLSPFWSQHRGIGLGLMLAIAVLPFYVGVLAERLVEARRRAEDANRAKGRFLANMSHEMRTPLNGVLAMSDLLRETNLSEGQREIVDTLTTSAQLLLAQIEDVLDEAKIEAGRIQIEQQPFDLGRLLAATVKVLLPQARYKGLAMKTEMAPMAARWYVGDGYHLRQVLLNLMSNAVKFTERGEVLVLVSIADATESGARLRFEVRDTGIGIPPEKQGTIFEPFTQADDSIARVYGGTGLGTTIARQLVALMGGELRLTSAVGQGSAFWFELQLPFADTASVDLTAEAGASGRLSTSAVAIEAAHLPNVTTIRGARILVAEDNPTNQRVTQMILESGGHHVTIVDNGEAALDALEKGRYDLALFDLSMPIVSGLEALKLYQFSTPAPIPVMILSATVTREIIGQCEQAGAVEFLPKPVRPTTLLTAITRHLDMTARRRLSSLPAATKDDERVALTIVEQPAVDPKVIDELARLSPDPTFINRIIEAFANDCRRLISEICEGLAKQRYEAVKDAAHALKGAASGIGANQLVQTALRLEKATHESMRARESAWTEELRRLGAGTYSALDDYLHSSGGQMPPARE